MPATEFFIRPAHPGQQHPTRLTLSAVAEGRVIATTRVALGAGRPPLAAIDSAADPALALALADSAMILAADPYGHGASFTGARVRRARSAA